YHLCIADLDEVGLDQLFTLISDQYKTEPLICCGDLADEKFLKKIIDQTTEKFNSIDVLVNNAAWRTIETMRTISMETWEKTLRICVTAPAFLSKMSAEIMEKRNSGGVIINISSMMSDRPAGNSPAYIASKGAIESLTRELAVTYGRNGIRSVCIKPGFIDTGLSLDYKDQEGVDLTGILSKYLLDATPVSRAGTPDDIADAIFWLSSSQASFISGTSLLIDGGFTSNMNSYQLKGKQFPNEY
ncbi:MAG TPA: SDR family oxidoreductase, partial [Chitinophagaceae bacterium]|nr:SDR family oxidoreductase [Chitinophagaceae bacterium]